MYIPQEFQENNQDKLISFIKENNFATLISITQNVPIATHLPFIIEKRDDKIFLLSHMAKANPQWKTFSNEEILIVFNGPNSYISPSNYKKQQNVPTWNYIAVHCYGKIKIITGEQELMELMKKSINAFESSFMEQWEKLNPSYVNGMIEAIIAFEVQITKIEGKFKLSQNKSKQEQENIAEWLSKKKDTNKIQLSNEMKKNFLSK